jgi:undecaprenyl diphosphate synthase
VTKFENTGTADAMRRVKDSIDPADYGIETVPGHVAIIMDGNGRWAKQRGRIRLLGHREGAKAVRRAVRFSYKLGVKHLTLFAFSAQNWARPESEVAGLMELLMEYLSGERRELMERGIRFRTVGDTDRVAPRVRDEIKRLEEESSDGTRMELIIALSYGGREDILQAARSLARDAAAGKVDPDSVDIDAFSKRLYTGSIPDPDLLIRTSGEQRISNFMLWQLAYSELHITDVLWPDFNDEHYAEALRDYSNRERRFGLTGAQVTGSK